MVFKEREKNYHESNSSNFKKIHTYQISHNSDKRQEFHLHYWNFKWLGSMNFWKSRKINPKNAWNGCGRKENEQKKVERSSETVRYMQHQILLEVLYTERVKSTCGHIENGWRKRTQKSIIYCKSVKRSSQKTQEIVRNIYRRKETNPNHTASYLCSVCQALLRRRQRVI